MEYLIDCFKEQSIKTSFMKLLCYSTENYQDSKYGKSKMYNSIHNILVKWGEIYAIAINE